MKPTFVPVGIMKDVLAALQNAEEAGGPEGEDYYALMEEVARVALERARIARANAKPEVPCDCPTAFCNRAPFVKPTPAQVEEAASSAVSKMVRHHMGDGDTDRLLRMVNDVATAHDFCDANVYVHDAMVECGIFSDGAFYHDDEERTGAFNDVVGACSDAARRVLAKLGIPLKQWHNSDQWGVDDAKVADAVIALLDQDGIRAAWEFPGYLSVTVPGGFNLAYGTQNGEGWDGHYETDEDGHVPNGWDPEDLPLTATPKEIATVLISGYRAQIVEVARHVLSNIADLDLLATDAKLSDAVKSILYAVTE